MSKYLPGDEFDDFEIDEDEEDFTDQPIPGYSNCSSTHDTRMSTLDELEEWLAQGREIRKKMTRDLGKLAEIQCGTCGRRPIILQGDVVLMCPHMFKTIECIVASVMCSSSPLLGVRVEVFDDGPLWGGIYLGNAQ